MPDRAGIRIGTIAVTELKLRFRRTTALVSVLLIAATVYLIVPDIRSGRTLMQINGQRALYTSAAVAFGTGMMCSILISMTGFYLVSNAFRRDIVSRVGLVISATPVSNAEYLTGKFLGGAAYLAALVLACMASAMVMFLLRGEGPLQPLTFLATYCWLNLPVIAFSAAAAIAFEASSRLSGRAGDLLFFFFWAAVLAIPAATIENNMRANWVQAFDIIGLGTVINQTSESMHTNEISIGASNFDPAKGTIVYPGLTWNGEMIAMRFGALLLPGLLFGIALLWFHRFDPVRVKHSIRHASGNVLGRVNGLLKPVTRVMTSIVLRWPVSKRGLGGAVIADCFTTLALSPLTVIAIGIFAVLSLTLNSAAVSQGLLPALMAVLTVVLADIAPRDESSGMKPLLFTAPAIRQHYVIWKFVSALAVTLCFTAVPALRLSITHVSSAISLVIGSTLIAAGAVGFGILSRGPKLFVAIFLMLIYIALNATHEPSFDFAGFNGCATPLVQCSYSGIALVVLLFAELRHRTTLRNR